MIRKPHRIQGLKTDTLQRRGIKLVVDPQHAQGVAIVGEAEPPAGFFKCVFQMFAQRLIRIRIGQLVEVAGTNHRVGRRLYKGNQLPDLLTALKHARLQLSQDDPHIVCAVFQGLCIAGMKPLHLHGLQVHIDDTHCVRAGDDVSKRDAVKSVLAGHDIPRPDNRKARHNQGSEPRAVPLVGGCGKVIVPPACIKFTEHVDAVPFGMIRKFLEALDIAGRMQDPIQHTRAFCDGRFRTTARIHGIESAEVVIQDFDQLRFRRIAEPE